uniref:Gamma-tubulin complex component 2 n=1 Tax=Anopheles dirus TaxID=7168 RepID=A0A182NJT5_9DIPT
MSADLLAKKLLGELVKKSGCTFSPDNIVTIFHNRDGKYSSERLAALLAQIFKPVPNGNKYVEMYSAAKPKGSYPALVLVLNRCASDLKSARAEKAAVTQQEQSALQQTQKTLLDAPSAQAEPVHKRVSLFESPPLSSTRIVPDTQVTPENVQEIKEKLVQATSGGANNRLSSSASLPPGTGTHHHHHPHLPSLYPSQGRPYFEFAHRKPPIVAWNFNFDELYPLQSKANVAAIPVDAQDAIVLKEVLHCLIGVKGSLIVPRRGNSAADPSDGSLPVEFKLSNQLTDSCRDMVVEILPLAANYSCVQSFIEGSSLDEGGLVLQALRAVLKTIVMDYYLSIAQLDDLRCRRGLCMQRLLQFLKPVFPTMEELAATVSDIRRTNSRGGQVLSLLHDRITATSGTNHAQKVLVHLIEAAAVPFMEMLHLWIYRGVINDPQQEFLIEHSAMELTENELVDYWEKQYAIRSEKVPCFLAKYADVILRTGKYLNVVRVCGGTEFQPGDTAAPAVVTKRTKQAKQLQYRHFDQSYIDAIEEAYNYASSSLLNLIMNKYDLMGRLLSVKRYFLLQQGDFITEFMDAVEEDLRKSVDSLHPIRLANLLDVTLGLSSAKYDRYHDDLKTMLLPYGIVMQIAKIVNNEEAFVDTLSDTSQLKGIECFTFTYKAQWPVSIVLNLWTISKYQMIFRQLFYLKYVERILCRVWIANNETRRFAPNPAKLYRSAFTLRQKMLIAIQSFESYMMIEVIEPNWHIFYQNMKQVKNIDDVLNYHQDFLDQCLKNCMLTVPDLLKPIIDLCNICIKFCDFLAQATTMAPTETFSEQVEQFRHDFTDQLQTLLRKIADVATLSTSERFINLIYSHCSSFPPTKMPFSSCAASFCKNNRYNVNKREVHVTFHTFPGQYDPLLKKWIEFCQRKPDWKPHKNDVLCSAHFREDDYQMTQSPLMKQSRSHRHLQVHAFPTVLNRPPISISKRKQLDEVRERLLEQLYREGDGEAHPVSDHTYSEAMEEEDPKKCALNVSKYSVVRLQRFPNVCAHCLKLVDDENLFTLVTQYHEELQCTIEQKYDELMGDPMNQEDRSDVQHLLPDKVCNACLKDLVKFHQYQRQLDCMRKFTTSIAQLLYGNREPLECLYQEQGSYLVGVLKKLDYLQGTLGDGSLEHLLEEVSSYRRAPQEVTADDQHTPAVMVIQRTDSTENIYSVPGASDKTQSAQDFLLVQNRKRNVQLDSTEKCQEAVPPRIVCPYTEVCEEWFINEPALQYHIREDHKLFKCQTCGIALPFYDLYKKHVDSHAVARALLLKHTIQDYSCDKCEAILRSEEALKSHKKSHAANGNYVCGSCLGVYFDEQDFNAHQCSFAKSATVELPKVSIMCPPQTKRVRAMLTNQFELSKKPIDTNRNVICQRLGVRCNGNMELICVDIPQ